MHELNQSTTAAFITLTYDNNNINTSENGHHTLKKKDTQDFLKRLRKRLEIDYKKAERPKLRYYLCGEYGTTTKRPHYHIILFNLPHQYLEDNTLEKTWKKGFVRIDKVEGGSIRYVCKYINKGIKLDGTDKDDDRLSEFSLMSKGMGLNFLTKKITEFYQKKELPYIIDPEGNKLSMPRYYKNKLYNDDQKRRIKIKAQKHLEINEEDVYSKEYHERIENKINLFARNKKIDRNNI